jgi:hypothetical protein
LQSSKRERKPSAEAVLTAVLIDLDAVIFPTFGIHFIFTRSSESFATHNRGRHAIEEFHCVAHHRVSSASERELSTKDAGAIGHWRQCGGAVPGLISAADAILQLWTGSA